MVDRLRMVASSAIARSDPQLLERLVGNLVSNAIKHTVAGGRVLVGCRRCGDTLCIAVFDSGIGIPEDQLNRIFDEYYRLVDHETGPRESLRLLLELSGYDVLAVATAREALAFESHRSPPRLVIADYRLGEGMTGVGLIRSLRESTGWEFAAVVMTGDSSRETRREIESADCRYELKPVEPDHLLNLVRQLVGQSHRARGMQNLGASSLAELVRFAVAAEADGVQIFPQ